MKKSLAKFILVIFMIASLVYLFSPYCFFRKEISKEVENAKKNILSVVTSITSNRITDIIKRHEGYGIMSDGKVVNASTKYGFQNETNISNWINNYLTGGGGYGWLNSLRYNRSLFCIDPNISFPAGPSGGLVSHHGGGYIDKDGGCGTVIICYTSNAKAGIYYETESISESEMLAGGRRQYLISNLRYSYEPLIFDEAQAYIFSYSDGSTFNYPSNIDIAQSAIWAYMNNYTQKNNLYKTAVAVKDVNSNLIELNISKGVNIGTTLDGNNYKIGPISTNNYTYAWCNYAGNYSGNLLSGITNATIKFDNGKTMSLNANNFSFTPTNQYAENGKYCRAPLVSDGYFYPTPNCQFYIIIPIDDSNIIGAHQIDDIVFEYKWVSAEGDGWKLTGSYTSTGYISTAASPSGCTYDCTRCAHTGLSFDARSAAGKSHDYWCGKTGYCEEGTKGCTGYCKDKGCNSTCDGHKGSLNCGKIEHTHTASCKSLACPYGGTHIHTPGCYDDFVGGSGSPICGKTEHKYHTSSCYYNSCGYTYEHTHTNWSSASSPGCYNTDYCTQHTNDYCDEGYLNGYHIGTRCHGTTKCSHGHTTCYKYSWNLESTSSITSQPMIAVREAHINNNTINASISNIPLVTKVSINKYIYDVEHNVNYTEYDSTISASDGRNNLSNSVKQNNPVYAEYGDVISYKIVAKNESKFAVKIRIKDILPEDSKFIRAVVGGNTITNENELKDKIIQIDAATDSKPTEVSLIVYIMVDSVNTSKLYSNTATIITRNGDGKANTAIGEEDVDRIRTVDDNGPIVNNYEVTCTSTINEPEINSIDYYKVNDYNLTVNKYISEYHDTVTQSNNTNKFTTESNSILTRPNMTEEQKKLVPVNVEQTEDVTYSIKYTNEMTTIVSNVPGANKNATCVRPTKVKEVLREGLVYNYAYARVYNSNGTDKYNKDIPLTIVNNGNVYTFEIDNKIDTRYLILNPGEYIIYYVNVKITMNNLYLYSLENYATMDILTNINNIDNDVRQIKNSNVDINVAEKEESREYVKLKDLVISGKVWIDRDKDGLIGKNGDGKLNGTPINVNSNSTKYTTNVNDLDYAIEGIVVKLYKADGTLVRTTKTDNKGQYTFSRYGVDNGFVWYYSNFNNNIVGTSTEESLQRIPKADNKDNYGNYTANSNYINYYIEYEYDGVIYKSTDLYSGQDNLDNYGEMKVINGKTLFKIDSNAKELDSVREEFNKKYEIISYNTSFDENAISVTALDFEKDTHESYLYIDQLRVMTSRTFVHEQTIAGNGEVQITDYLWLYQQDADIEKPSTDFTKYINLGLQEREKVDLSLTKDIYSITTTINGEDMTYYYDQIEAERAGLNGHNGEFGNSIGNYTQDYVSKNSYSMELYESDYKYRYTDYENSEVQNLKGPESELNVEVVYKITVDSKSIIDDNRDSSSGNSYTDVKLNTKIHEIVDYYDENFVNITYTNGKMDENNNANAVNLRRSQTVTVDNQTIETFDSNDRRSIIAQAWYYDNNDTSTIPHYLTFNQNTKFTSISSENNYKNFGYNVTYISGMENVELAEGQDLDIFVKYVLDKSSTSEMVDGVSLDRVLQILEKNKASTKEGNNIENIAQINVYSVWYEDNKPASIVDCDSNAGNTGVKTSKKPANTSSGSSTQTWTNIDDFEYYDDTSYKSKVEISVNKNMSRLMSGHVWEEARTDTLGTGEETQYIGDGLYDPTKIANDNAKTNENVLLNYLKLSKTERENYKSKDINIRSVKVEYVEIIPVIVNGQVRYYEEKLNDVSWIHKQNSRTDINGNYILQGFIPGYYIIRYTYGDGGSKNYANLDTRTIDTLIYNGHDYKSTKYTGKNLYLSHTDYDVILMNLEDPNQSDAVDDEERRLEVISYSETMKNSVAEVLKGVANGTELTPVNKDENVINTPGQLQELAESTSVFADTVKFYVKPEKLDDYLVSPENYIYSQLNQVEFRYSANRSFQIRNVDFGIEYRPETQISLNKEISLIKLTSSDGNVLVNLPLETIDRNESGQVHVIGENAIGADKVQFLSNTYQELENTKKVSEATQGFVFINLDDEILQGCTLEIEYHFVVENNSEIDRISSNLDKLRFKENITDVSSLQVYNMENNYSAAKYASKLLGTEYGTHYKNNGSLKEVIYRTKVRDVYDPYNDVGYYGKYVGESYYTGTLRNSDPRLKANDVIASIKFDKILDYLDKDLVYKEINNSNEQVEDHLWSTTSSEDLLNGGYIRKDIFVNNKLQGPKGQTYDEFNDGKLIKGNLLVSVNDRLKDKRAGEDEQIINEKFSKFVSPLSNENSAEIYLKVSKVLSAEVLLQDMRTDNIAEVIQFVTQTGRRTNYKTTIGNAKLKGGEFNESTKELDSSTPEYIILMPPTGLVRTSAIIKNIVQSIYFNIIVIVFAIFGIAYGIATIRKRSKKIYK